MRPPRKTPGKGENRKATWSNEKLKGGGVYNGWKAGVTEWVLVHHVGNSKPCYDSITDGKLACPWCKPGCRRDWIGYVPIYDASGKRLLAVVQDYAEPVVDKIPVFAPVRVRRGKAHHDPICIEPSTWTADPWAKAKKGDQGVDIFEALLILWGQPLLKAFFADSSDTPVSPPTPVPEPEVKAEPVPPELAKRDAEGRVTRAMRERAASIVATEVDRITWPGKGEPSKNGKHAPE